METLQEQYERYKLQQTESGKKSVGILQDLALNISKITGKRVKSGKLTPMVNAKTDKITSFIEHTEFYRK